MLTRFVKSLFKVGANIPDRLPNTGSLPSLQYRIHKGGIIEVTETFVAENYFGWEVTIPAGFVCDGASIPPLFWPVIGHPFSSELLQPALAHDYLCNRAALFRSYEHRIMADGYFFWLLKEAEVPYWRRTLIYLAVRFYGRLTYKPNTAELCQEINNG